MTLLIQLVVNGEPVSVEVQPHERLVDLLRDRLGLTGTKEACGNGECGACTVLLDGRAVNACLVLAADAEGREVVTIEGLSGPGGELSRLQRAFVRAGGIQCGFCSPGMILAAKALLDEEPSPSEQQIRRALVGNLCRCTGYTQIVSAVKLAAGDDDV